MVFLFLCDACERGDPQHCSKGHPAPPGVYGGSKCNCFSCNHKEIAEKCNKIDKTFEIMKEKFNENIKNEQK